MLFNYDSWHEAAEIIVLTIGCEFCEVCIVRKYHNLGYHSILRLFVRLTFPLKCILS